MIVIVKRNLARNEDSASPPDRYLQFSIKYYLQAFLCKGADLVQEVFMSNGDL